MAVNAFTYAGEEEECMPTSLSILAPSLNKPNPALGLIGTDLQGLPTFYP